MGIIFTIHFGGKHPLFLGSHPKMGTSQQLELGIDFQDFNAWRKEKIRDEHKRLQLRPEVETIFMTHTIHGTGIFTYI